MESAVEMKSPWRKRVGEWKLFLKKERGKSIPRNDFCKNHLECVRFRHSEARKEEEGGGREVGRKQNQEN